MTLDHVPLPIGLSEPFGFNLFCGAGFSLRFRGRLKPAPQFKLSQALREGLEPSSAGSPDRGAAAADAPAGSRSRPALRPGRARARQHPCPATLVAGTD